MNSSIVMAADTESPLCERHAELDVGSGVGIVSQLLVVVETVVLCAEAESLVPFVDAFQIGDGEEVMIEFTDMYRQAKREGWSKEEFLRKVCHIPGVYVPSLYEVTYNEDGTVKAVTPKDGAPAFVQKRHSSNTAV